MIHSLLAIIPVVALSQLAAAYPLSGNETMNVFGKRDTLLCGLPARLVDFHACLPAGINFELGPQKKAVSSQPLPKDKDGNFEPPVPAGSSQCGMCHIYLTTQNFIYWDRSYH